MSFFWADNGLKGLYQSPLVRQLSRFLHTDLYQKGNKVFNFLFNYVLYPA
jgi:hypothetical protein